MKQIIEIISLLGTTTRSQEVILLIYQLLDEKQKRLFYTWIDQEITDGSNKELLKFLEGIKNKI